MVRPAVTTAAALVGRHFGSGPARRRDRLMQRGHQRRIGVGPGRPQQMICDQGRPVAVGRQHLSGPPVHSAEPGFGQLAVCHLAEQIVAEADRAGRIAADQARRYGPFQRLVPAPPPGQAASWPSSPAPISAPTPPGRPARRGWAGPAGRDGPGSPGPGQSLASRVRTWPRWRPGRLSARAPAFWYARSSSATNSGLPWPPARICRRSSGPGHRPVRSYTSRSTIIGPIGGSHSRICA